MNLTITESAAARMHTLLTEEGLTDQTRVRVFVQGGGCSGMEYGFTFDDSKNEDDWEIPAGTSSVLVDSMSMQYLENSTVKFEDDIRGASFVIDNPGAKSTCGCGSSFSY